MKEGDATVISESEPLVEPKAAPVPSEHAQVLVRPLDPRSTELDQVLRLYRANKATLGFLPKGALDEFVEEGCVLVALVEQVVVGYLAYRISGSSAKIVHLCVDSDARGTGVAQALANELFRDTATLQDIRLLCRADYELTDFWPRLGFVCVNEKPGRSKAGKALFLWVRRTANQPPLLAAMEAVNRANRRMAAVDANVFYDFDGSDERSQESQSLLADWLADDVMICVTAEIRNEISRHSDGDIRARRRRQIDEFTTLEATADRLDEALGLVAMVLPAARDASDQSDRRQLAHAIAERADFFITRDQTLLTNADALRAQAAIAVLRPTDFLVQLHAQTSDRYAPARLVGSSVIEVPVRAEAELATFQRFAQAETKAQWLNRMRPVLSEPHRFETRVVSWGGEARAVYAVERTQSGISIPILRGHRDARTPTVLRRLLAELLVRAQIKNTAVLCCDDLGDPTVESALADVGFVRRGARYEKWTMRGVVAAPQLLERLPKAAFDGLALDSTERTFWPLKIRGADVPSFVVPIWPYWASQLFDADLASRDLFGARLETALALENVYYSSSSIVLPEGARILWYVSDTEQSIRAASISLGTIRGTAKQLFRRFSRLGVYAWQDLMKKASGDPDKQLLAYRFAYTERLSRPVSWADVQAILQQHTGRGNPFAGPTRVPEQVFFDVYRAATGL